MYINANIILEYIFINVLVFVIRRFKFVNDQRKNKFTVKRSQEGLGMVSVLERFVIRVTRTTSTWKRLMHHTRTPVIGDGLYFRCKKHRLDNLLLLNM